MLTLAIQFLSAFLISTMGVYAIRQAARRVGWFTRPREDRWHTHPTPSFGGIGVFLATLLSLALTTQITAHGVDIPWVLLIGATVVFGLGLYDDIKHITPQAKLVGQILAASIVIFFGYTTLFFTPRLADNIAAQIPNILLTFFWLVGITNAFNLLDNMDGLAAGIACIAAAILSFLFWRGGDTELMLISLAIAGSALGFLLFNFPPASIFMGDSGSLFLGFTLAVLAIARQPQASNVFAVVGVPTVLFLLPILDTTLVTVTRLLRGQSPAQGGRDHTSHRLVAFGLSERQALAVLYTMAGVSGVVAIVLESLDYDLSLVLVPLLLISLALFAAYLGRIKVVVASSPKGASPLARLMVELTYRRRLLEVALDFFLISVALYLAFWVLNGFRMTSAQLEVFSLSLPVALGAAYLSFFAFGVYRGVWKYIGLDELLSYIKSVIGAVFLAAAVVYAVYGRDFISPVVFVLFALLLFLALAATRSSFRILDSAASHRSAAGEYKVAIYGAGDTGEMAARWILMNPALKMQPVGFLDDDLLNAGRRIHGVKILGGFEELNKLLEKSRLDGVIVTFPIPGNEARLQEIIAACQRCGCWVRTLRLEFEEIG